MYDNSTFGNTDIIGTFLSLAITAAATLSQMKFCDNVGCCSTAPIFGVWACVCVCIFPFYNYGYYW